jgi:uncharacterized protein YbgA (DUF1722 family)
MRRQTAIRLSFVSHGVQERLWLNLVRDGMDRGRLVQFHTDHKYLLLAHGRGGYDALGRLVADAGSHRVERLFAAYERGFVAALQKRATRKTIIDVLQHMLGFFEKDLTRQVFLAPYPPELMLERHS